MATGSQGIKSHFLHTSTISLLAVTLWLCNTLSTNLNYGYLMIFFATFPIAYFLKLDHFLATFLSWLLILLADKFLSIHVLLPQKAYDGLIFIVLNALILSAPVLILKVSMCVFPRLRPIFHKQNPKNHHTK
ncbi:MULTISPECIES: hypothetical protein [Pseudoalteromonas]|uniref:hypothetical protein n=1 Tax=Pseudoalteromonas TaxID=53246 RepID=UPI001EFC3BCB|nr:hypothetical protein [Pseudoalteromonas sp. Isolate6]MCG9760229.1 hypothetical protein [Pseudoalteromonas sp. Isolate6]